jgi:hypothetical protein
MAAFTEGFSYHGNNIDVVSKVMAARSMAKAEREYAEKTLAAQQKNVPDDDKLKLEDFGIKKGYFFRKALKHEFGGDYYLRKKEKISDIVSRVKLLKNPRKNFFELFEKRKPTTKFSRFRSQFDYNFETSDPAVQAKSPKIPGTAKKIQKATAGSGKRISREQLLDSISGVVKSIESVADSIQSSSSEVKRNIISSNIAQTNIAEQLKSRNDTLSDKLDKIAAAISQQTQLQKQTVDKREDQQRETRLESQKDVARTITPDDLTTPEDESLQDTNVDNDITPTTSITNIQNLVPDAYSQRNAWREEMMSRANMPQLERGGIVSGPDSGYLAKLHGDEMIVPLDNNYTQGQPSAVDGKTRKKPQMFEKGTSGVGGRFGFGTTRNLGIGNTFASSITNMSQPLVDAMSLPMMVAGGSVVAATTNLMKNLGGSGEELRPEIEKFSRPISDAFGVPPTVMNKAKAGTVKGKKEEDKAEEVSGESKKNIIAKMMDGFGKLLEKMSNSINETPPQNPPGGGDLSPVNLQGFSQQEISDLGKMVYAEAGADPAGSSHVLNAILNRYRQVKQGKATPQAWGVKEGVTAQNMTITDLLMAENQFQPVRDGRFAKVSAEQGTQALNAAIGAGGLDPKQIYEKAKAAGLSDAEAKMLATSDTFYNPTVSSNKPFNAPVVNTANKHAFMASPNTGFSPADLNALTAVQRTQPPTTQPSTSLGQQITENYGMNIHDKFYFKLGGVEYHAYKTAKGFDFYKGGTKITDPEEERKVIQGFVNLKSQAIQRSENATSLAPPSTRQAKIDQAQQLNRSTDSSGASTIAYLNLPSAQSKPSLNTPPPTSNTTTIGRGYDPLNQSGLYIPTA